MNQLLLNISVHIHTVTMLLFVILAYEFYKSNRLLARAMGFFFLMEAFGALICAAVHVIFAKDSQARYLVAALSRAPVLIGLVYMFYCLLKQNGRYKNKGGKDVS